jgi:predicted Zn-dependent peptidase
VHPYQWATIGKELSHVEGATLDDVKEFFFGHYAPNNAVLSISGNISKREVMDLSHKWFGSISRREVKKRNLPAEPRQEAAQSLTVNRDVPYPSIYKAYHMCNRSDKNYHTTDLISDILSNGKSSRLYQKLVQDKKYFSEINAYITGEVEEGLFMLSGNLMHGVTMDDAEKAIDEEINKLKNGFIFEYELQKVKNKVESTIEFSETNILNKAMNMAKCELLGDVELVNQEVEKYTGVQIIDIKRVAEEIFTETNCSTLYYLTNNV